MVIIFVDSRTGDSILREYDWKLPIPGEGDVLELHSGHEKKWVVEEIDWVFADAAEDAKDDIAVKSLKVMVCQAEEYIHRGEGDHRMSDPICECGHTKSVHAPSRCLGSASTCQCTGFVPKGQGMEI